MKKFILFGWIIAGFVLFLYSFTQVDLSLTLSRVSVYQTVEKMFQYVGYFNRPLSTILYLAIIGIMFILYAITLNLVRKKIIEWGTVWKIVICLSVILFFAYNAFSYDLFNYIFDAKIVTHYHQNPYVQKALDYPGDPMLSFMHWTHRTYPYGPAWLVLTVPLSYIGVGYFLLTFYLFKLLIIGSFIWSAKLIKKIAEKTGIDPAFAVAGFALNPLVLVESLVSAHNDIVMIALGLFGILMFLEQKYIKSLFGIVASILVKYATALLIPAIIARGLLSAKGGSASGRKDEVFFYVLIASMSIATLFASYRTNFQPWYLLIILPFTAFVQKKYFIAIPVFIISIAALLQYVPYLYLGNWNPPVPSILNWIMIAGIAGSTILILGRVALKRS